MACSGVGSRRSDNLNRGRWWHRKNNAMVQYDSCNQQRAAVHIGPARPHQNGADRCFSDYRGQREEEAKKEAA